MENVTDTDVAHYEGLVRKTASLYVGIVEEDYEDICQILRVKAWRALLSFDPAKSRTGKDRYVFSCIKNQCKDLVKRVKRNELFIEDLAPADPSSGNGVVRDAFEQRYLEVTADQVFASVEDDPLIPSTLTKTERIVVGLMVLDFDYGEISRITGDITRKEVATTVRSIREKMADWRPDQMPPVEQPQAIAA